MRKVTFMEERRFIGEYLSARIACGFSLIVEAFEEEGDWQLEGSGDVPKAGRIDMRDAGFVLLDLLDLDAEAVTELLPGQSQHPTALPNFLTEMLAKWPRHSVGLALPSA